MASIDMRILFGIDIKDSDFERASREMQRIQNSAKLLNEELNKAGNVSSSGFSKLVDSLSSMGRIGDTIKNVNSLTQSIEGLSRAQGGLSGLVRGMSDLGRSINESMGESKVRLLRQYNVELEGLRTSAQSRMDQGQRAGEMADRAESMGNPRQAELYRNLASQRGLEAGQGLDAYNQFKFIRPVQEAVSQALRIGGLAAITTGAVGASASEFQNISEFAPVRGQIAFRNLILSAAQQAASGNITTSMMQNMGIGLEQDAMRGKSDISSGLRMGARYTQGVVGSTLGWVPILGNALSGGRRFQTSEEIFSEMMGERRQLDIAKFGPLFQAAGEMGMDRLGRFGRLFRTGSFGTVNEMLTGMNRRGISDELMGPAADITMRMGLDPHRTLPLAREQLRLGLSDTAFEQLLRLTSRDPNATGTFRSLMGQAGMRTLAGAETVSQAMGDVLSQQVGFYGAQGATGFIAGGARAAIAAQPNLPEAEVAGVGTTVARGIQGMAAQPGNFVSAGMDMALINLGVNDPIVRIKVSELWGRNPEQAVQVVANFLGVPGDKGMETKIRQALGGITKSYMSLVGSLSTRGEKAFGAVGISLGASLVTGGLQTGGAGTMSNIAAQVEKMGMGQVAGGESTDFGGVPLEMERARAARQTAIMDSFQRATGDMGQQIFNAIKKGFMDIGNTIADIAVDAKMQPVSATPQVTSTSKGRPASSGSPGRMY